jgi:hypothetical protein
MFNHAQHLLDLREEANELERQLKEVKGEISDTEHLLVGEMASSEIQNFSRAGRMFSLTIRTRASTVAGRKEELFEALRAEGFGDMVVETVNANTLSSFVKEQREGNNDALPSWLEGLVSVYDQPGVSVRKSTKK